MLASRQFKLNQKIQTQASFLGASFHWLLSSWRHHAGRCRGALPLGARSFRRAAQRKPPYSASPWQRARLFPEAVIEVGGARPELRWESATWEPQATSRLAGAGPGPRVQGVSETDAGRGWCVLSARRRGRACWVWFNGFWVLFSHSLYWLLRPLKAQVPKVWRPVPSSHFNLDWAGVNSPLLIENAGLLVWGLRLHFSRLPGLLPLVLTVKLFGVWVFLGFFCFFCVFFTFFFNDGITK